MMRLLLVVVLFLIPSVAMSQEDPSPDKDSSITGSARHLLVVQGVSGTAEFGQQFADWSNKWEKTGESFGFRVQKVDGTAEPSPREKLAALLEQAAQDNQELWIVLIGHGTFDGELAKLNLVGKDVSAREIRGWLGNRTAPTIILNCTSCSAPFIDELSGNNRIVVTATKSGYEMSFSHFGQYLADAISDESIDLDKDEQTSLLEAVIVASSQTEEFYKADSRLATEHALIDDNGDGKGTPVSWFRGIRVAKQAKDGTQSDGLTANQVFFSDVAADAGLTPEQLRKRNQLEEQIEQLRSQRSQLTADQYYHQLESILVPLSRLYQQAEKPSQQAAEEAPAAASDERADDSDG